MYNLKDLTTQFNLLLFFFLQLILFQFSFLGQLVQQIQFQKEENTLHFKVVFDFKRKSNQRKKQKTNTKDFI